MRVSSLDSAEVSLHLGHLTDGANCASDAAFGSVLLVFICVLSFLTASSLSDFRTYVNVFLVATVVAACLLGYAALMVRENLSGKIKKRKAVLRERTTEPMDKDHELDRLQSFMDTSRWAYALPTMLLPLTFAILVAFCLVGDFVILPVAFMAYSLEVPLKAYIKWLDCSLRADEKRQNVYQEWDQFSAWIKLQRFPLQTPAQLAERYAEYIKQKEIKA